MSNNPRKTLTLALSQRAREQNALFYFVKMSQYNTKLTALLVKRGTLHFPFGLKLCLILKY
jgi:hypothetical protein